MYNVKRSYGGGVTGFQMIRGILSLFLFTAVLCAQSPEYDRANKLYERTQYSDALRILLPLQPSAPVLESIGKNYFMMGEFKKAQEAFEKAITEIGRAHV